MTLKEYIFRKPGLLVKDGECVTVNAIPWSDLIIISFLKWLIGDRPVMANMTVRDFQYLHDNPKLALVCKNTMLAERRLSSAQNERDRIAMEMERMLKQIEDHSNVCLGEAREPINN